MLYKSCYRSRYAVYNYVMSTEFQNSVHRLNKLRSRSRSSEKRKRRRSSQEEWRVIDMTSPVLDGEFSDENIGWDAKLCSQFIPNFFRLRSVWHSFCFVGLLLVSSRRLWYSLQCGASVGKWEKLFDRWVSSCVRIVWCSIAVKKKTEFLFDSHVDVLAYWESSALKTHRLRFLHHRFHSVIRYFFQNYCNKISGLLGEDHRNSFETQTISLASVLKHIPDIFVGLCATNFKK